MANLQVRKIPDELHERLRRRARADNITVSALVLAAVEQELARREWRERWADRPAADLGMPAAKLVEEERRLRDRELG